MIRRGKFDAEPNPVEEGKTVTIAYSGRLAVSYSIDFGDKKELVFDAMGNASIKAPIGASLIFVRDAAGNHVTIDVLSRSGSYGDRQ